MFLTNLLLILNLQSVELDIYSLSATEIIERSEGTSVVAHMDRESSISKTSNRVFRKLDHDGAFPKW